MKFAIGDRVRLTTSVDRLPHAIIPSGETGVIQRMDDYVMLSVKLDRPYEGLREWNNELEFYHGIEEEEVEDILEIIVDEDPLDASFERVSVLRCPRCKASKETDGYDGESAYPIMVVESAQHVHHAHITPSGSLELVWDLTTDGSEDWHFICQKCGHVWEVPSCFNVR